MVKLRKNKLKELNKLNKKHASPTNKILKKKLNLERKVTFHKEALFKETVNNDSLIKTIKVKSDILKSPKKQQDKSKTTEKNVKKHINKPVEKKKKRQKTQVCDTKLILSLMKKKFNNKK